MSRLFASRIGMLGAAICVAITSPHALAERMTGIVVDANGVTMGPYYPNVPDFGSRAGVLLNLGGQPVLLPLNPARLNADPVGLLPAGNHQTVYFESTDCSGLAWLLASSRQSVPGISEAAILTFKHTATAYVPSRNPRELRQMKSSQSSSHCNRDAKKANFRRVEQVVDLLSLYVAPYYLQ